MLVGVGSQNSPKIQAVKNAFTKVFGECSVEGISVKSGISSMPITFEETAQGATNRAKSALEKLKADFGVGLEGGIEQTSKGAFMLGVVVIFDKNGVMGMSKGGEILVPDTVFSKVKEGIELSKVIDEILGTNGIKNQEGTIGYMTKGIIDRTHGFEDLVVLALARFIRPELY